MKEARQVNIEDALFIDIETASRDKVLVKDSPMYDAWEYKNMNYGDKDIPLEESYKKKAALDAEFSRVVCVTICKISEEKGILKTYRDLDEQLLLSKVNDDLNKFISKNEKTFLCGHSVKAFDIPFLFKRSMSVGVIPSSLIDVAGLKPWELTAMDTKELWKGSGSFSTSLVALCLSLGVDSPKQDISGAQVSEVYHNDGKKGLDRICQYCEEDVKAVVNIFRRFRFENDITEFVVAKQAVKLGVLDKLFQKGTLSTADIAVLKRDIKKLFGSEHPQAYMLLDACIQGNKNSTIKMEDLV